MDSFRSAAYQYFLQWNAQGCIFEIIENNRMKYFSLLFISLVLAITASSQANPLDQFKNMRMRAIGPATTSGRVTAVDVVEGAVNTVWVGTASGGVWKSENDGYTFEPVFDKEAVIGIGSLAVDPTNPDVVWVGTGEGNPRNSQTSGKGIYRSLDAGRTWQMMGLENTKTIHRVLVNPHHSQEVYAAAMGSAWGPNADRGVFKTMDAGKTWQKILFINDSVGCADLVMDPNNPNKLFAAMWQYNRHPWFFKSGGKNSGLHRTADGGKTWTVVTDKDGFPKGEIGRIGVAVAPSNSRVVYALVECAETGLYKSEDGGYKWELVTTKGVDDRPFYYSEIYVDPKNENHLIYLHSVVSESIDGGKTWKTILPYYGVHPDHHAFWWSSVNSHFMIDGNDGGLNISEDGGRTWQYASNLPLGQFYHVNYDMATPYNVYGGLQDNGSWKGPAYVWHSSGIVEADWQELTFGDGFDVVPNPADHRFVWSMSQGGYLTYLNAETGEERFAKPVHPKGERLRFNWNAAIAQDPKNPEGVFYGSQYLHHTIDGGLSWSIISPDLTTNDTTRQKSAQSGGLTIDATAAENFCTILCIAPSEKTSGVIWVGTDDGQVQLTTDGGNAWKNVTTAINGLPKNAWIPQIVVSPHQEGGAFVVANNYRQNDWSSYLFYTSDYGKTWKRLVNDQQVKGHCLSIVQDPVEKNLLFLGTEHGLYVSNDFGKNWHQWKNDYPSVATQDLKIHPRESDLIIGTFGRALYILDDITPLRKWAANANSLFTKTIVALENPTAIQSFSKRAPGERFPADTEFAGDNRTSAARLNYFYNPAKEVGEKKEEKKVKVSIHNERGDTVRWFLHEPDTAVNIVLWDFDTNGILFPTTEKRETPKEPQGGGLEVAPGLYKVVFQLGQSKDSSTVLVQADTRATLSSDAAEQSQKIYDRFKSAVKMADTSYELLKQYKEEIEHVKSSLPALKKAEADTLVKEAGKLMEKIIQFEAYYFLPNDSKGIRDDSDLLVSELYTFMYAYLPRYRGFIGGNAETALQLIEGKTKRIADEIQLFDTNEYSVWQKKVEQLNYSFFSPRIKP